MHDFVSSETKINWFVEIVIKNKRQNKYECTYSINKTDYFLYLFNCTLIHYTHYIN